MMKQLLAFSQKEILELIRSGRLLLFVILFIVFGIMNPALAKLTPWLLEQLATTLAESGIVVVDMPVDALTSWQQFYKNFPMALIIYTILSAGVLTNEYQHGTLINMVTKGLPRWKIILAKTVVLWGTWTLLYSIMFAITYAYNAYFWDNSIAADLWIAGVLVYLFGIFILTLVIWSSTLFKTSTAVMASVGALVIGMYGISVVPTWGTYLPTQLLTAQNLLTEVTPLHDYQFAIILTGILIPILLLGSIVIFNQKRI
ncbi:MAG: ABC transporter permease [Culicoidibacterales bacterium]